MIETSSQKLTTIALACGIAVPVLYFGSQFAAAPFYQGYSFLGQDASTLGSPDSSFPALFSAALLIVGLLMMITSVGIARFMLDRGVKRRLAWPISIAIVAGGLASVNGGLFPLPDERHTTGLLAQIGIVMFALPLLLPLAFRTVPDSRKIKTFLWLNLALALCLVPIVSGLIQRIGVAGGFDLSFYQHFLNNSHGILQRIAAGVVFIPIGVISWFFLSVKERPSTSKT